MRVQLIAVPLLALFSLTACTAAKVATRPINKLETKMVNTTHARAYSKALSKQAPRLLGTWTDVEARPIGKTYGYQINQRISLFSDGVYAYRSERFGTYGFGVDFYNPGPTPAYPVAYTGRGYKYGVDTGRGRVRSSKGTWVKAGPGLVELTAEGGGEPFVLDLSGWTNRSADFNDWLGLGPSGGDAARPDTGPPTSLSPELVPSGWDADGGPELADPWWNDSSEFREWLRRNAEGGSRD